MVGVLRQLDALYASYLKFIIKKPIITQAWIVALGQVLRCSEHLLVFNASKGRGLYCLFWC